MSSGPINQLANDFIEPAWCMGLRSSLATMQIPQGKLGACLLPPEKPMLQKRLESLAKAPHTKTGMKRGAADDHMEKYQVQHLESFQSAALQWPPVWDNDEALTKAVQHLPRRAQEAVYFYTKTGKGPEETVHDVNMNLEWNSVAVEVCPTIVCSSTLWLRKAMREIWGAEALSLQGFPLCDLHHEAYSHTRMMELAGNAFNGLVVAAVMTAAMTHISFPQDGVDMESQDAASEDYETDEAASVTGADTDFDFDAAVDEACS